MLARYRMHRGRRPVDDPLPEGIRKDTRHRTRHCLRPSKELVERYLRAPSDAAWAAFEQDYLELVAARFAADRSEFDALAALARERDVYLGCSCPTRKNPDVRRCHTYLGLRFMERTYPELQVEYPEPGGPA